MLYGANGNRFMAYPVFFFGIKELAIGNGYAIWCILNCIHIMLPHISYIVRIKCILDKYIKITTILGKKKKRAKNYCNVNAVNALFELARIYSINRVHFFCGQKWHFRSDL